MDNRDQKNPTGLLLNGSCHCNAVRFTVRSRTPYPYMRCYCSICRKTAGGGGYAINIMGIADTLDVEGEAHVTVYQARLYDRKNPSRFEVSQGRRHFCGLCGSALWIWDPKWPELVHPFASTIDTTLPLPPERLHIFLADKPEWVSVSEPDQADSHFDAYPFESIEAWHRRLGLWQD